MLGLLQQYLDQQPVMRQIHYYQHFHQQQHKPGPESKRHRHTHHHHTQVVAAHRLVHHKPDMHQAEQVEPHSHQEEAEHSQRELVVVGPEGSRILGMVRVEADHRVFGPEVVVELHRLLNNRLLELEAADSRILADPMERLVVVVLGQGYYSLVAR